MNVQTSNHFFSLEGIEHSAFILKNTEVWEALLHLESYFQELPLGTIRSECPKAMHLVNPSLIFIGERTTIEPGAYIEGPSYIGSGCEIRCGAYIRPYSLIGNGCIIGHATEVKHSILFNEVKAAHYNYIGDSIVGSGVLLGAGVVLANMRLDKREVSVYWNGLTVKTGLRKMGAVIGDQARIGCHSTINPGSLLPKGFFCPPSSVISRSPIATSGQL